MPKQTPLPDIILPLTTREALRQWYIDNAPSGQPFLLPVSRSRTPQPGVIPYLDAVEEALCFGYIDSTTRRVNDLTYNRFSPRRPHSHWTALNLARCRRLDRLGLMTDLGRALIPSAPETIGQWIITEFQSHPDAYARFLETPRLYQRIKLSNIHFTDTLLRDHTKALAQLTRLIDCSRQGRLLGEWNDNGRLSDLDF